MRVLVTIATALSLAAASNCKLVGEACNGVACCDRSSGDKVPLACMTYWKNGSKKNQCYTLEKWNDEADKVTDNGSWEEDTRLSCRGGSSMGCKGSYAVANYNVLTAL